MAKSFFDTLEEGTIEVEHCGEKVTLNLPEWLVESANKLEDVDSLKKWAEENEIMHGLLHNGLQKLLIDLRAVARPGGKKAKETSIVATCDEAQERLDNYILEPVKRPGASKKAEKEAIEMKTLKATVAGMRAAKLDDDMIVTALMTQFNRELVVKALEG